MQISKQSDGGCRSRQHREACNPRGAGRLPRGAGAAPKDLPVTSLLASQSPAKHAAGPNQPRGWPNLSKFDRFGGADFSKIGIIHIKSVLFW
jgi:hypothetical protein